MRKLGDFAKDFCLILVRDVLDFEPNFGLSIIYAEAGDLFGKFWKNLELFWSRFCVIKTGRFMDERDDRDEGDDCAGMGRESSLDRIRPRFYTLGVYHAERFNQKLQTTNKSMIRQQKITPLNARKNFNHGLHG